MVKVELNLKLYRTKDFQLDVIHYVDNYGKITENYPFNPNGSPNGIAGITNSNGRVLAMMPHQKEFVERNQILGIQLNKVKNGVNMVHGLNYSNLLENGLVIIS